jgi:hypothetical protein
VETSDLTRTTLFLVIYWHEFQEVTAVAIAMYFQSQMSWRILKPLSVTFLYGKEQLRHQTSTDEHRLDIFGFLNRTKRIPPPWQRVSRFTPSVEFFFEGHNRI